MAAVLILDVVLCKKFINLASVLCFMFMSSEISNECEIYLSVEGHYSRLEGQYMGSLPLEGQYVGLV